MAPVRPIHSERNTLLITKLMWPVMALSNSAASLLIAAFISRSTKGWQRMAP
ncbi:hypothetical protein D3C72_2412950 [compost metagenome]